MSTIAICTDTIAARTIRKIRRRLLPLLFLLYIVAYLDRINIGFAAFTMNKELGITSSQFGLLAGVFFWGYVLFEIPSNLILHRTGARLWIARILVSWGIVAGVTGFVHSVSHVYAMRFLLGVTEAGFFPGILLYLTYWFRRRDQAQVIALFLTGLPVASIVGAPLSGLILDHGHWFGISSWRWLLILEGIPAIACGILTWFFLPSRPTEAAFLEPEEKDWIAEELRQEEREKAAGHHHATALHAVKSPRVWYLACISFTYLVGLYAMSFWMPQALKAVARDYSNTLLGVLVMIPHLAGVVAMVFVSRSSDRRLERRYHAAISLVVASVAIFGASVSASVWGCIILWSAAAMGIYSFLGPFWALPNQFLTGLSAASGIALINSIGNIGGFVGPSVIGFLTREGGGIYRGMLIVACSLLVSALLLVFFPEQADKQTFRR